CALPILRVAYLPGACSGPVSTGPSSWKVSDTSACAAVGVGPETVADSTSASEAQRRDRAMRPQDTPAQAGFLGDGRRDIRDLAPDDLLLDLLHRGHVGLRHLRADLPEPDAVLGQAEDGVAAATELAVLHVLHG